jgi:hypothetical protein
LRIASGAGLARDLAQVVSEPIFDIFRLVACLHLLRVQKKLLGTPTL